MDRQQRDDVRAIQQMTRWVLLTLQNAERGLLPSKVLQRAVDPQVLQAMGPFTPPPPGVTLAKPRVGRLRVQLVHDKLAHVACVAPRPDGTPAGYLLEFRKPPGSDGWRVTELTRAEERRLVRPELTAEQEAEEKARRLPADLTDLLAATRQARDEAAESLEGTRTKLRQLPDPLSGIKTNTVAQRMKRDPYRQERAQLRRDVGRWKRALAGVEEELKQLHEIRESRELRQRAIDGDPLMRVRKWEHLDRLLGPVPQDPDERAQWRQAASTVEAYRDRWNITDPEHALGDPPVETARRQQAHRQAAVEAAAAYNQLHRQVSPARETADEIELAL